jgi:5-methylcytosine-specific restriction endonuclease McrA
VDAGRVVWAGELTHRGQAVHEKLVTRRAIRCGRRQRHTRYRPARFANRRRPEGWLPPSLESRLANTETWVGRLCLLANVTAISQELVKFDTQALQNPEISGAEYQQGTLAGYELREYLLEKWGRRCAYCHATGVPLQVKHIVPKTRNGGSDRASNLTLACAPCNQRKGTRTAEEFGHPEVQAQAQRPLRDAAAVNASRWALFQRLRATGLPVETGTGGRTKWNRTQRNLPKTHWLDAACVGASTPEHLLVAGIRPLTITATGRHARQMRRMDRFGFPRTGPKATSTVGGLHTGDLVRAVVPAPSVKAGTYVGRLAVRASGMCNITTARHSVVQGIHVRHCRPLQRSDGYGYGYGYGDGASHHTETEAR